MMKNLGYTLLYSAILFSLFMIDSCLGNGFLFMVQKTMCKVSCFIKKFIREADLNKSEEIINIPLHFPTLFIELLVLLFTLAVLKKVKHYRGADRLDRLIHESKEALRISNEFLEKWRMRRVPNNAAAYSYLDEEPQEIKPLKLEVPILHMAIVDTRGATRKQQERGDAGDSPTCSESTVLSLVSLFGDDDIVLKDEPLMENIERNTSIQNRYLWDVEEEDPNVEY